MKVKADFLGSPQNKQVLQFYLAIFGPRVLKRASNQCLLLFPPTGCPNRTRFCQDSENSKAMDSNPSDNTVSSRIQIGPQLADESLEKGPKVYHSPKLWHLRVSVIEAEHIMPGHRGPELVRFPEFVIKVQVGDFHLSTAIAAPSSTRSFSNPFWNEDLLFAVDEPFVNSLQVTVQDRIQSDNEIVVATGKVLMDTIEKRVDERPVTSSWFNLESHHGKSGDKNKASTRFVPRIHLRVFLDGGYHVFDEVKMNKSDHLIGVLYMKILGARGLEPVQIKDTIGEEQPVTNAYCVAKYGQKWCRTRNVVDSLSPEWNEEYSWEVYDLCTVVTIGVFYDRRIIENVDDDDEEASSDDCIGKVKIRLSILDTDRTYTHSYPLLIMLPSGVKRTGEIHLSTRLSCSNVSNMLLRYTMPLLPMMHYGEPITEGQRTNLTNQAKSMLVSRLSREEPPLGRKVVEYMLEDDMWNLRISKANFYRMMGVGSGLFAMFRLLNEIRNWQKPAHLILFIVILVTLMMHPKLIILAYILYIGLAGLANYRCRPRHPPGIDARLSQADGSHPDELDEEFDTIPTTRPDDIVRMRYDRLRSIAGRFQTVVGDLTSLLERLQALVNWRDPRATTLFLVFCLVSAFASYVVPIRVLIALFGMYWLRPPWFRSKSPPLALNFFRRLPSKDDCFF
ncbi:FT-interacting protein 3 isoform X4 [Arachis hypogaea]|uniref:FT-interacting protein 3 isoform X4 n=1 Tax=Arachis hypogaea TaxID=3818 RepID=UPI003B226D6C